MAVELRFRKTGRQIKEAVAGRRQQLQQRLDRRNGTLNEFMQDVQRVRSYLVRSSHQIWGGHDEESVLYAKGEMSSEEVQEVGQLCRRIFDIEQELHRLALLVTHLPDDEEFELSLGKLAAYGFEAGRQGTDGRSRLLEAEEGIGYLVPPSSRP